MSGCRQQMVDHTDRAALAGGPHVGRRRSGPTGGRPRRHPAPAPHLVLPQQLHDGPACRRHAGRQLLPSLLGQHHLAAVRGVADVLGKLQGAGGEEGWRGARAWKHTGELRSCRSCCVLQHCGTWRSAPSCAQQLAAARHAPTCMPGPEKMRWRVTWWSRCTTVPFLAQCTPMRTRGPRKSRYPSPSAGTRGAGARGCEP